MSDAAREPWILHDVEFLGDQRYPQGAVSPWSGHRRFAYDLVTWLHPSCIVELGTHFGVSYFAMAQAVKDQALDTTIHAIDTFEGESHAGLYGQEVLDNVNSTIADHFADTKLVVHQKRFEDAVHEFDPATVNVLHIDGFHSYEAARRDFETWKHTLAPSSIVLFHDVSHESGYGSADYWDEISSQYPSLSFPHSFGLGVLFPTGTTGVEYLLSDEFTRWKPYYVAAYWQDLLRIQVVDTTRMIDERDIAMDAQTSLIDERDAAIQKMTDLIVERDAALADQGLTLETRWEIIQQQGNVINQQQVLLDELRVAEAASRRQVADLKHQVAELSTPPMVRAVRRIGGRAARSRYGQAAIRRMPSALEHQLRRLVGKPLAPPSGTPGHAEIPLAAQFVDPTWYLATFPEIDTDPVSHFLSIGYEEGRSPCPWVDVPWYAKKHGINVTRWLDHYLSRGAAAGAFLSETHREDVLKQLADRAHVHPWRREVEHARLTIGDNASDLPIQSLAHQLPALVTFDLWDTLVCRDRPADAAKVVTSRAILLHAPELIRHWDPFTLTQRRVEIEASIAASDPVEEYHISEVLTQLLDELGFANPRELAEHFSAMEAADEARHVGPILEVAELLSHAITEGREVRILSDFYTSREALHAVMCGAGVEVDPNSILVSCEQGASKRFEGGLFLNVRDSIQIGANDHLHIGDNPHADNAMQCATGGQSALLKLSPGAFVAPGTYSPETLSDTFTTFDSQIREGAFDWLQTNDDGSLERLAEHAGRASALFPVALVMAAIEQAERQRLDAVHYLSREGLFLTHVHNRCAQALGCSITAVPLSTSRRSTFGPSIANDVVAGLREMWAMYPHQSIQTMLGSIGVQHADGLGCDRFGLRLTETVENIAQDPRVSRWLANAQVLAEIQRQLTTQHALLSQYLTSHLRGSERHLIVDVGWRGTIQDNIARTLPERHFSGVYLGLFEFLNPQLPNTEKSAVAFNANLGDPFTFVDPPAVIERPWTPDTPTTVGYATKGTRVVPVTEPGESPQSAGLIDAYQAGVLDVAPEVAVRLHGFGLTNEFLPMAIGPQLKRHFEHPPLGVADIWFESRHDDTFGAANESPYRKQRPNSLWFGDDGERLLSESAASSRWEDGYLRWLPVAASQFVMDALK